MPTDYDFRYLRARLEEQRTQEGGNFGIRFRILRLLEASLFDSLAFRLGRCQEERLWWRCGKLAISIRRLWVSKQGTYSPTEPIKTDHELR